MPAIVIFQNEAKTAFLIKQTRNLDQTRLEVEVEEWKEVFVWDNLSRDAVVQIERYLKRMLTENYLLTLQQDAEERARVERIYSIGARR